MLLNVSLRISSYLPAKCYTVWADRLAKPLAERLPEGLQTLLHILRRVHSAILKMGAVNRKDVKLTSLGAVSWDAFRSGNTGDQL